MLARALILLGLLVGAACAPVTSTTNRPDNDTLQKITFDLTQLDPEGLVGPSDGKRALSYEFCIPTGPRYADEVRSIDPTAQVQPGSRGRIGCSQGQALVIGSTHQPDWRAVLARLAALDYVQRIDQAFFE